ncbi:MAG: hypothetical protein WCW35_08315 [Bacteroidota bacterium]
MTTIPTKQQLSLADESMKLCLTYVSFVYFAESPNKQGSRIHANGTCSFVDTGTSKFAITNHHVIEGFRTKQLQFPELNFQIGSEIIDIENRIISESEYHDLVTFRITDEEMAKFGKTFCFCRDWPPLDAVNDEAIFFAGYPGEFRTQLSPNEVEFQSILMTEVVKSSSPDKFTIVFDKSNWMKLDGPREVSELTHYGGLSGTAIFRLNEKYPIHTLEPIGIIYEGGNVLNIQLVKHISFINKDGVIKQS